MLYSVAAEGIRECERARSPKGTSEHERIVKPASPGQANVPEDATEYSATQMKIGIDARMYSSRFTGIGRYVYELTSRLFELDKKNEYVLFFNEPEYSKYEPPSDRVKKVLADSRHYTLREQIHFLRLLNNEKLDLMHFTHFNAPVLYRKPSIVTIHDLTLTFFPGKKMAGRFHRAAYHMVITSAVKKAKKIIAVSNNTKKDLQKILHADPQKVEVIYEGVNANFKKSEPDDVTKTLEKLKIATPYLLYTGVWRSHKNVENLIRAFHKLKTEYGYSGGLVITGSHDPIYAPGIFSLAAELNVTDDIVFTGMVDEDELIALYNGADVYVFPSRYEGFGLPPLEAMQCGTPVAASGVSCIPEVCGKENALFFDPNYPSDMAEKIFRVTSEAPLRETLIKNGLEHVKKFSWDKMARQTLEVYNDVLKT